MISQIRLIGFDMIEIMAGQRFSTRRKKSGSGLVWGGLAIGFIVVMIKWGVPWFVNILAGPAAPKGGGVNTAADIVPPQIPVLFPIPEATNSANLKIEGFTEGNVEVNLFKNDELFMNSKTDDKGAFKIDLKLSDGENKIQVKARDAAGNESQSVVKTVMYDKKASEVTIDAPKDGDEIFGKNNQTIAFSGKVTKVDSVVTVNGNFARVDVDGKFSVMVKLSEGDNNVVIKATDKAGNIVEKTVKVKLTF